MVYVPQLQYLMNALQKMNLQALLITPETIYRQRPDFGLRKLLGMDNLYEQATRSVQGDLKPNAINKLTDEFFCNYIFLRLPDTEEVYLIIGPYVSYRIPRERLLEKAERYNVSAKRFSQFETCFSGIPTVTDDTALFALLSAFGETVWGKGSAFEFIDLTVDAPTPSLLVISDENMPDPEETLLQMQAMEKRYAYENELMDNVSQGLVSRAERMIRFFPDAALDQRSPDPIRNIKNYCIVCNTLMRKAAERGGVHPFHLDRCSSALAKKAELISEVSDGMEMMLEMVRTYCRLVRQYTIGHYPPLVQKVLTYMDANLAGDLRLHTLASMHNVSDSYLSALFHREYGKTLTECILQKRIEAAADLLLSTHLQVQTVAQHCGFSDVNYFSKVFKRIQGVTPKQFREKRSMNI